MYSHALICLWNETRIVLDMKSTQLPRGNIHLLEKRLNITPKSFLKIEKKRKKEITNIIICGISKYNNFKQSELGISLAI